METAFRSEERFTQEEFWRWLQERPTSDVNHYELIRGRIVMTPPAGWLHGAVGARLVHLLVRHVAERGLGVVQDASAGYDLPSGDTLEPDASFISSARLTAGPEPIAGRFLSIVPDLAIEILSGSTAGRDRGEQKDIYAANGVDEYWLVDARRREVTVLYRAGAVFGEPRVVASGRVPSRVLPDLGIDVAEVFADLR